MEASGLTSLRISRAHNCGSSDIYASKKKGRKEGKERSGGEGRGREGRGKEGGEREKSQRPGRKIKYSLI